MKTQVLDVAYKYDERRREPIITIYGKLESGATKIIRVRGFLPYFYALPNEDLDTFADDMQVIQEHYNLNIEVVQRFKPMGYQKYPTEMLKISMSDPKDTRLWRDRIKELLPISEVYETDILFKNRFMIDLGIRGMGWIEFPEKDFVNYKEIKVIE